MAKLYLGNTRIPLNSNIVYLGSARAGGGTPTPTPPAYEEYGELANYIKNTTLGAYVDTGYAFKTSNQKKILTVSKPVDNTSLRVINGSQGASNSSRSPYIGYNSGQVKVGFGSQSAGSSPIVFDLRQEKTTYTLETKDDNTYRFEDSTGQVYEGIWSGSVVSNLSDYLFKLNYSVGTFFSLNNVYTYVGYDDNVKAFDLVPLYISKKAVTDTAGRVHAVGSYVMWDLVTNTVPSHIGDFIGERKIYPDWVYEMGTPIYGIKTSGDSYIDTGFSPTPDLATVDSFTLLDTKPGASITISGCRSNYANDDSYALWKFSTNGKFRLDNGAAVNIYSNDIVQPNVRYNIVRTPTDITINGIVQASKPSTITTGSALSIYIGTVNNSGTALYYPAPLIIHEWAGKNADKEIKLIAFIHKDGTVGMLDLVSKQMFGSATATPFEAITDESVATTLSELGVISTGNVEDDIKILGELGVSM